MPYYRLYRLHPDHGHIIGAEELETHDDGAAIEAARQQDHDDPVELWEGARKIGRIDGRPQGAAC